MTTSLPSGPCTYSLGRPPLLVVRTKPLPWYQSERTSVEGLGRGLGQNRASDYESRLTPAGIEPALPDRKSGVLTARRWGHTTCQHPTNVGRAVQHDTSVRPLNDRCPPQGQNRRLRCRLHRLGLVDA